MRSLPILDNTSSNGTSSVANLLRGLYRVMQVVTVLDWWREKWLPWVYTRRWAEDPSCMHPVAAVIKQMMYR